MFQIYEKTDLFFKTKASKVKKKSYQSITYSSFVNFGVHPTFLWFHSSLDE